MNLPRSNDRSVSTLSTMARTPKLPTELVGTFLFLSVIALSGAAGPLAPLAIGSALMALVYMGGHISGAHYNPRRVFWRHARCVARRRLDLGRRCRGAQPATTSSAASPDEPAACHGR